MKKFRKINHTPFPDSLIREAEGLDYLRRAVPQGVLKVVEVFAVDQKQLLVSAVQSTAPNENHWEKLAAGLAALHKQAQRNYGFENDNYIGLNPQINGYWRDWGEFFVKNRLRYQVGLIRDSERQLEFTQRLASCAKRLTEYLNETCAFPSLVHGDLWNGNVLFDKDDVWLIDPAIYFGDREVDIAMTEMFGGFSPVFYQAYNRQLPLSSEYPRKKVIYNFYHYLNHLNLFGESYLSGCESGMVAIEQL